jgi:glycosyltransferase involved in cell wall biosynthesis
VRIIVVLPWGRRLGGAEALLESVLGTAPRADHEMELVFLEDGPWPRELRERGFRVEVLPAGRLRDLHRWGLTVLRLARLLRARRPDVVLNWAAKTQLYGAPAAVLAGMRERIVWWQHMIADGDWLDRVATALPAVAVGCCSHAAAVAQRRMRPVRSTFVCAAGTAPPPRSAAPAPVQLPAGVPVVGIVGRLQPWKGQDRLLRAQAILRDRGQRLHLLIVGGDAYGLSPEYAGELPALAARLGLRGEVTMTGQVSDAGTYISEMDVLVNASDPEPFGIVLLEGMARGVAVAAVDSGGPAEFVADGETGVLARSGDPADLADAVGRLLGDADLRMRVAAAGRAEFFATFTDEALQRRFFAAMQAAVSRRAARRS